MNGYDVYLGDILFPIAPETIDMKINGQNTTQTLINEGEINILKLAGLTTVSFSVLLPAVEYPFASYIDGFQPPSYYLEELEVLKQSKEPFQLIIARNDYVSGKFYLHNTNMTVSLEDYTIKEGANEGFDMKVEISLKQYKHFATKTFKVEKPSSKTKVKKKRKKKTTQGGNQSKTKQFKVQIPGMGVVKVWATSVQEAIKKASGKTWSGTIYVDGKSYYVRQGTIIDKTVASTAPTIKKTIETVVSTVVSTYQAIVQALTKTGREPTQSPTQNTNTSGGNYES